MVVKTQAECHTEVVVRQYNPQVDGWLVRFVRFLWPRSGSVIGMTVHRGQPPTTLISSGNLYEALYGRELDPT